jgi:xanthine dehydrogenase molybdopterin-binding subunit B
MYQEGQLTHYLQPVVNCNMQRVWEDMLARSNFTEREAATRKFNGSFDDSYYFKKNHTPLIRGICDK